MATEFIFKVPELDHVLPLWHYLQAHLGANIFMWGENVSILASGLLNRHVNCILGEIWNSRKTLEDISVAKQRPVPLKNMFILLCHSSCVKFWIIIIAELHFFQLCICNMLRLVLVISKVLPETPLIYYLMGYTKLNQNSRAYTSTLRYKSNTNVHTCTPPPKDMCGNVHSSTIYNSPGVGWMLAPYKVFSCLNP